VKLGDIVKPPLKVNVSETVEDSVVCPTTINTPLTVKFPKSVFVFAPPNVKALGHVALLLVIVDAALIPIPDAPAIVYVLLNVQFPAIVNPASCVIVAVYPVVIFRDKMVIAADIVLLVLPLTPAPSNVTSSADVGTEALFAPPLVLPQLVFPVAFQFELEPPPTQYLEAL
jgi:hypothetical protein